MRRMQADGLVETYLKESSSGPPRKYYKLTATGQNTYAAQKAEWSQFSQAVNDILGSAP
jgi:PadR family transcriptional regulator PadR